MSTSPLDRQQIESARDTMRHRGPDDAGCWISEDGRIALAHRRLSVVDLSARGHQPMRDPSGQVLITYNGEVYNYRDLRKQLECRGHRFASETDTEVVLAAYLEWGDHCLQHFNGMFALAIYDARVKQLLLARDRAGEKPLYYAQTPKSFAFASELKGLLALGVTGRRLDLEAFEHYLAYGYVPGDRAILAGVRKLPPAHALRLDVDTRAARAWRYWQLPRPVEESTDEPALLEELERLLEDSIRQRLSADVPVGILLSGGLDSGLVAAIASRVSTTAVRTFTVSFPGNGRFDEGPAARRLASHFGTVHTELVAESASVDLLPLLARQYNEPIADSSMVPTFLVSRLIRQHATVALTGDGGDELFGGYLYYSGLQRYERYRHFMPSALRKLSGQLAAEWLPTGLPGRSRIMSVMSDRGRSIAHINSYFDPVARRRLTGKHVRMAVTPEAYKEGLADARDSVLRSATETDFRGIMTDAYLVKVDRASMLNSLEVRVPLLDTRLIEFAFGRVPDRLRATGDASKVLLRRLAKRHFPPEAELAPKQGFSIPLSEWLRGTWGDYFEAVLSQADATLFDRRYIRSLLAGQRRGFNNTHRLFALTIFELWRREYQVSV